MSSLLSFGWPMLIAAALAGQWIVVALASVVAPVKMRTALAMSTAVFALGWLFAFNAQRSKRVVTEASAIGLTKHGSSCASIRNEMTGAEVQRRLGSPDEIRSDEAVRGPGSSMLIYRDLRCAVHLFDEKVELVD